MVINIRKIRIPSTRDDELLEKCKQEVDQSSIYVTTGDTKLHSDWLRRLRAYNLDNPVERHSDKSSNKHCSSRCQCQ